MKRQLSKVMFTLVVCVMFLGIPQASQAAYSWPDIIGASYKQALEVAYKTFMDTMVANMKIEAANLIRGRIETLLTGSSRTPLFITNYQEFIYGTAQRDGQLYVSNFFNTMRAGVSSQVAQGLYRMEGAVTNEIFRGIDQSRITIDNYVQGGFNSVFDASKGGGYAAFNNALERNYYTAYIDGKNETQRYMAMRQDSSRVEAITGRGYISNRDPKTNLIKTPGALIADLTAFAESLPMRIVAYAKSIPEVVGSMAAQTLSQTVQNGISKVTRPIDNQLRNIHNTVHGGVNQVQSQIYSGIKFSDDPRHQQLPRYRSTTQAGQTRTIPIAPTR